MIYLLLSILASTQIFIVFKLIGKFKIDTLQTIVVNYFAAFAIGIFSSQESFAVGEVIQRKWFLGALFLGILFITIFNVMALVSQRNGLSVASVASKMSVVIPIIFGLFAYNEGLSFQKTIGILLALLAVYFASIKANSGKVNLKNLWFPILLFLGSGVIDTTIKFVETTYVSKNGIPLFSATIFLIAGLIGLVILFPKIIKGNYKLDLRSLISGSILGVINYYSIYMLLKALQVDNFESSSIFTINNVAIVMLTTLIGLAFFKEKLSTLNWTGIILAIISIILVTLA